MPRVLICGAFPARGAPAVVDFEEDGSPCFATKSLYETFDSVLAEVFGAGFDSGRAGGPASIPDAPAARRPQAVR